MAKLPPFRGASFREAVSTAASQLAESGSDTAMLDARLLLFASAGIGPEDYLRDPQAVLTDIAAARFATFLERRAAGSPISRILGSREFYGRSFRLSEGTLDPRPDTETLIDAVLNSPLAGNAPRILDLGVGSGAILLTLLAEIEGATGLGIDRSEDALKTARTNAVALGLEHRAGFCCADWLAPLGSPAFDIVVANPPYIASAEITALAVEVRDHDPLLALDGGPDGLDAYRRIIDSLPKILKPGGAVFFEIGETQAEDVAGLMGAAGLTLEEEAWLFRDLAGRARGVTGKWQVRRSGAAPGRSKKELGTAASSG
ncbi:Release factor glutamine methyltransferase [Methyloligella halotolerans]|uniref:Release factor glutamine methyltransferase n=1 Tax=Methyloligella halotolerans TaxID=1177755 RepID=A0A1E2RZ18_9HYPH|nr:peptide chain release factor N(5)-glutamine methyltransferase [Methyloligella halotolerans]ODA67348.1 Release factor glutamine methyltransferase [Methyloligella halotolerans]